MNAHKPLRHKLVILVVAVTLACNLPTPTPPPPPTPISVNIQPTQIVPLPTPTIAHQVRPPDAPPTSGTLAYDVESSGTAPEQRAPYGDSYKINRLERPFQKDMTYVPDLDIVTYTVSKDSTWYYVSIELIGTNPNNELGISYGVEIDLDADGFGDTLIWSSPPYTPQWDVVGVKVLQDKNHDTGGRSADKSDAPLAGDGYETLVFDSGQGNDPDLAWVRINAGRQATVQFALKQSLVDSAFMLGTLADAGWKDPGKLDYVDRIPIEQAGSPVRDNSNYPLKELYLVDNACREAIGFKPSGYEPQLCPKEEKPPRERSTPEVCQRPPYCVPPHYYWNQDTCTCVEVPW